jgi:hypothetical protein
MQTAFQMLVAGVGFFKPKTYNKPAHYTVFSHEGEHIGDLSCGMVNKLIHDLNANIQGCSTRWGKHLCYERITKQPQGKALDSITFGFEPEFNFYVEGLMVKFERLPIDYML